MQFHRIAISGKPRRSQKRRQDGSALSEFGPALFFLFIFAIFPVLDMILCGYSYLSCVSLNDLQLREAAKLPRTIADSIRGPVKQDIPNKWKQTIIGGFSGTVDTPETGVFYSNKTGTVFVTVTTTVVIHPFLNIPFFVGVPGIGAPLTAKISNKRVMENPQNYLR